MCRLLVITITVCLFVTFAVSTNVRKCSNGEPFPLSVDISGCDEPPCDAIKGSTAVMNMHFVGTKDNLMTLKAKVKAIALGMPLTYNLPDDVADVCRNLLYGAICPIDASEDVVYQFNFYVDLYYPEISVKLEVSLVDEVINETVTCFGVDIKVKKGAIGNSTTY